MYTCTLMYYSALDDCVKLLDVCYHALCTLFFCVQVYHCWYIYFVYCSFTSLAFIVVESYKFTPKRQGKYQEFLHMAANIESSSLTQFSVI